MVNPLEDEPATASPIRLIVGDAIISVARARGEDQRRLDEAAAWEESLVKWGRPSKECPYTHLKILLDLSCLLVSACWEAAPQPMAGSPEYVEGSWRHLQMRLDKAASSGKDETSRYRNKFWGYMTQG